MTTSTYVYRAGKVRKLKEGVNLSDYLMKAPDAFKVCKPPCISRLEEMVSEGVATAIDGCHGIEPDGECHHGRPSWLRALGYI